MKKIVLILTFLSLVFAKDVTPSLKTNIEAGVLDMVVADGKLYVATDKSAVMILDAQNLKKLQQIQTGKIKDFMGTPIDRDIYSVDVWNSSVLLLAQAEEGYAELFLFEDGKLHKVMDKSLHLYAKAAKFVTPSTAILALMSDELVLYDMKKRKIIKRAKAGEYFYSCMTMSKDRKRVVMGDEGGEVIVVDTKTLRRVKLYKNINKDKILSLSINGDIIVAGGRCRKLVIYDMSDDSHKIKEGSPFFIYVTAMSPDRKLIIYGDNEKYILKGLDSASLSVKYRFIGHKNVVNVVRFIDNATFCSASETGEIFIWRVK